jgi:hypothetical protein
MIKFGCINNGMNRNRQYAGQANPNASAMNFSEMMRAINRPAVISRPQSQPKNLTNNSVPILPPANVRSEPKRG